MKICQTWNCKGKLVEEGLTLKCKKCGREYWNIDKMQKQMKRKKLNNARLKSLSGINPYNQI